MPEPVMGKRYLLSRLNIAGTTLPDWYYTLMVRYMF